MPYPKSRFARDTERYVDYAEIIGFTAAALTSGALFPQVRQSWRTRSTGDLNLRTYLILTFSITLFLSYGSSHWIALGHHRQHRRRRHDRLSRHPQNPPRLSGCRPSLLAFPPLGEM